MPEEIPEPKIVVPLITATIAGFTSWLLICSALRPRGASFGALSDAERYVAGGLSAIIFLCVAFQMYRGRWSAEQMKKLLELDHTDL